MKEIKDTGLMPEGEMSTLNQENPSFTYGHSGGYDLDKIKHAADVASLGDVSKLDEIVGFLRDENPTVRYWGANGCLILGKKASAAREELVKVLKDASPDVRISAAEALCHLDEAEMAVPVLIAALAEENEMVRVHALNSIDVLGGDIAKSAMPVVLKLIEERESGYDVRAAQRLVDQYGD
jgi:hypothetical protein